MCLLQSTTVKAEPEQEHVQQSRILKPDEKANFKAEWWQEGEGSLLSALDPSSELFTWVAAQFNATCQCPVVSKQPSRCLALARLVAPSRAYFFSSPLLFVLQIQIECVQNAGVWSAYCAKRESMELEERLGVQGKNEKHLWHGTRSTSVQNIAEKGFNVC